MLNQTLIHHNLGCQNGYALDNSKITKRFQRIQLQGIIRCSKFSLQSSSTALGRVTFYKFVVSCTQMWRSNGLMFDCGRNNQGRSDMWTQNFENHSNLSRFFCVDNFVIQHFHISYVYSSLPCIWNSKQTNGRLSIKAF